MHVPHTAATEAAPIEATSCPACDGVDSTTPTATQSLPTTRGDETGWDKLKSVFFSPLRETPKPPLQLAVNDAGLYEVATEDGFKITFSGHSQQWVVEFPDGRSTRIWGDPHVNESDGDKWDFTKQSTFYFGKNKATVETAPFGNGGATVSKRVSIYNGIHRVTIDGIDTNNPTIESGVRADGVDHDQDLYDGTHYHLKDLGNGEFHWDKETNPRD